MSGDEQRQPNRERRKWTARRLWQTATRQRFFAILVLLIVLFVSFALTQDHFFTLREHRGPPDERGHPLGRRDRPHVRPLGGRLRPLDRLDARFASSIALGTFVNDFGIPIGAAIILTLAFGALLGGGVNGVLIGRFGLSFLVVTLATLIVFRGLVNPRCDARTEQVLSSLLDSIAFDSFLAIPIPVWIMAGTF